MAQKFILVILLFTFVLSANAWNLFRCNQDGSYTYLGDHEGSFNSAAEKIGYTSGQIYSFYGDLETQSDINFVGFRNL